MWILDHLKLPKTLKEVRQGLPLFTLPGAKPTKTSGIVFNIDNVEVLENPPLTLQSEGFLYRYPFEIEGGDSLQASNVRVPNQLNTWYRNLVYLPTNQTSESVLYDASTAIFTDELEESQDTSYLYSYYLEGFSEISYLFTEGLKLTDVSYNNNVILTQASSNCRPQLGKAQSKTLIVGKIAQNAFRDIFRCYVFDFTDEEVWGNIDSISSLDYTNATFIQSSGVENYTLHFDPISKLGVCLAPAR
jgi:hypothetical protein